MTIQPKLIEYDLPSGVKGGITDNKKKALIRRVGAKQQQRTLG